jgi:hypothetical protein
MQADGFYWKKMNVHIAFYRLYRGLPPLWGRNIPCKFEAYLSFVLVFQPNLYGYGCPSCTHVVLHTPTSPFAISVFTNWPLIWSSVCSCHAHVFDF